MTAPAARIGTPIRRRDGAAKLRGEAIFGVDCMEPGMLHARILRSPIAAGRIVCLDLERARRLTGVHAVLDASDVPAVLAGPIVKDHRLFAAETVRYAGEPIAAIAAQSAAEAEAALNAILLEVEPADAVFDVESALRTRAPLVHPDWRTHHCPDGAVRDGNLAWEARVERGDVDGAFATADLVVEDEFVTPRQHQCALEPHSAVARYEDGRFVIRTSSQHPFNVRDRVAELLGVDPASVRVLVETVGGGFGAKLDAVVEPYAALLARATGRPVKLTLSRTEEFATGAPRESAIVRIRSAVDADGRILAREALCLMDNGACCGVSPGITGMSAIRLGLTYRTGAVRTIARLVYTNTPPTGPFRGVNGPYLAFAIEAHMDHIARRLRLDRRALRVRTIYREGDELPIGQRLEGVVFQEALAKIEEVAPWAELSRPRPHHGVGLAAVVWRTNPSAGTVTLRRLPDGTVALSTGGVESGTGAIAAGLSALVAAELDIPVEQVRVGQPDTDTNARDAGAQGSRTLALLGPAALEAARDLRDADEATACFEPPAAAYDHDAVRGVLAAPFHGCNYHVHLAEVRVDPATGHVEVLRYIVAQDVGRAIDPLGIRGQVEGGVMQGIGYALYEGGRIVSGVPVEQSFETYRVPTVHELPPIELITIERPTAHGPHGAKGVGEPVIVPVAAAIASAVADAIGTPIKQLPMTPFAVLAALREAGG